RCVLDVLGLYCRWNLRCCPRVGFQGVGAAGHDPAGRNSLATLEARKQTLTHAVAQKAESSSTWICRRCCRTFLCPLYPRKRACGEQSRMAAKGQKRALEFYSISSLACASSAGGTVMPSAFAVFRLITSSCLVGACTGRSAGFSPLRMRST